MSVDKILVHIEDEDARMLAPNYLAGRRRELPLLFEFLEKQDFQALRNAGHKMKGSGGGFGLDEISDMGAALEAAAHGENAGQSKRILENIQDYVDRVRIAE